MSNFGLRHQNPYPRRGSRAETIKAGTLVLNPAAPLRHSRPIPLLALQFRIRTVGGDQFALGDFFQTSGPVHLLGNDVPHKQSNS